MLLIRCPHCGPRPEIEFRHGGEAHIARPTDPAALDDEAWAAFLFVRSNPRGLHAERWNHQHGCQRWFNALRDTVTDRFLETDEAGAKPGHRTEQEPAGR
jgi:sarcosine oxidase, subunit delta